jgi:hypothetical protein
MLVRDNKQDSETIMSMQHSLAAVLWLLTAVGGYALVAAWADDAQSGKLHPWVLLIVFWAAALVSAAIHHLSLYLSQCLAQGPEAFRRYWIRHRPALSAYAGGLARLHMPIGQALVHGFVPAQAAGRRMALWCATLASAAVHDLSSCLAQATDVAKRLWAEHSAAIGRARLLPAVVWGAFRHARG